jgi:hypothetical protein
MRKARKLYRALNLSGSAVTVGEHGVA